jgi:DNA-binding Lrp family transcriptional regulator
MASDDELIASSAGRDDNGLVELLVAIIYREGPLSVDDIADRTKLGKEKLEAMLSRLVGEGRIESVNRDGILSFSVRKLVIPLGASAGWEAAVFDHYKAVVSTIMCKLRAVPLVSNLADKVGGSTYTFDLWPGHPMEEEVYGILQRFRAELSDLRERAAKVTEEHGIPEAHTRTVIYLGQSLIHEGSDENGDNTDVIQ